MSVSRRGLVNGGVPLALTAVVGGPQDPAARLFHLASGAGDVRRFEDFGAKGDYDFGNATGTDDTQSIQAAIDWAYGGGRRPGRAILVESKNYLCGSITTHPYTTLIGTGRQTSNFVCRPGTTGVWWGDRGRGAQKLMLSGLAWYGQSEPGVTSVCRFGRDGIQFGTEGILQGLWMRDAPNATGLDLSGNVGIVRDVTVQSLDTGIVVYGNGNHLETIISMQVSKGARFHGSFVRGLHLEAIESGGLPLFLNGDSRVSDVMFSLADGTSFDHLVEVDDSEYTQWSLRDVQIFPRSASLNRSLLKLGDRLVGGKRLNRPQGLELVPEMEVHGGRLSLAGQRWRAFTITLARRGGRVMHAIGPLVAGTRLPPGDALIAGASASLTATSLGPVFANGARWSVGMIVFDTAPLPRDEFALTASVVRNTTGRAVTVEPELDRDGRFALRFWDAISGSPWEFPAAPADGMIKIAISGFGG